MDTGFLYYLGNLSDFLNGEKTDPELWREAWVSLPDQIKVILREYIKNFPALPKMGLPEWAVKGAIFYGVGLFKIAFESAKERRERFEY